MKISKFVTFKNILLVGNAMGSFSGFTSISIDPKTFEQRKSFLGLFYFALSFALSGVASSAKYYLPIASITRSLILEVMVNVLNSMIVYTVCFYKIANFLNNRAFWKMFKDLHSCSIVVNILFCRNLNL